MPNIKKDDMVRCLQGSNGPKLNKIYIVTSVLLNTIKLKGIKGFYSVKNFIPITGLISWSDAVISGIKVRPATGRWLNDHICTGHDYIYIKKNHIYDEDGHIITGQFEVDGILKLSKLQWVRYTGPYDQNKI